jgi:hypothetical protein
MDEDDGGKRPVTLAGAGQVELQVNIASLAIDDALLDDRIGGNRCAEGKTTDRKHKEQGMAETQLHGESPEDESRKTGLGFQSL